MKQTTAHACLHEMWVAILGKCMNDRAMNRNHAPIEHFIQVFGNHFHQKGSGLWIFFIDELLRFWAEDKGPSLSYTPSNVHAVHDLNSYGIIHLHNRQPPSREEPIIIWTHPVWSHVFISDKVDIYRNDKQKYTIDGQNKTKVTRWHTLFPGKTQLAQVSGL